ncbi:MAG: hypothetical protein QMC95_17365 [Desulfitobacteriaceae bacterium]|nr:hypothetical protein [Desulfitobacteriaceae bacterium]MDI6915953.1 hypothetical protein [Desulfitobacteriaceae bacterium]
MEGAKVSNDTISRYAKTVAAKVIEERVRLAKYLVKWWKNMGDLPLSGRFFGRAFLEPLGNFPSSIS